MATRAAVVAERPDNTATVTWSGLLQSSSDVGAAWGTSGRDALGVSMTGTLGTGGAITWQGSFDGGTTWGTLKDQGGNEVITDALGKTFTIDGVLPPLVRPNVTAGNGSTNLVARLVAKAE